MELLGYATGNGHLYLVYEYIQNGSLSEHLHDPLLKGSFGLPTLTSHLGSVTIVAFFFYVIVLIGSNFSPFEVCQYKFRLQLRLIHSRKLILSK